MVKKYVRIVIRGFKVLKEHFLRRNKKVDLIVIGAQKCGTTALHQFLSYHPDIVGSNPKEVHFFNFDRNYSKGIYFYHTHFKGSGEGKVLLDASPSYFMDYNSVACERIYKYNPNVKLILLLRNPIDRAFSAYMMYKKYWKKNKDWFLGWREIEFDYEIRTEKDFESFDAYIEHELTCLNKGRRIDGAVLPLGVYYKGLEKYLSIFKKEQLLVIEDKKLLQETENTLDRIIDFVKITPYDWDLLSSKRAHVGKYDEKISPITRMLLEEYYEPYNEKLFALTGLTYSWN